MEITLDLIVFTVLAVFTLASAVLAVTTKRILRAATFLLFVLFGTAGIYFQLNYSFLGAVQLLIYAGGITVLYVFSILLTSSETDTGCGFSSRRGAGTGTAGFFRGRQGRKTARLQIRRRHPGDPRRTGDLPVRHPAPPVPAGTLRAR